MWAEEEKTTFYKPASEPSPEPDSAGTLHPDFEPPEVWEIYVIDKPPHLWYFVIAVWTNYSHYKLSFSHKWDYKLH